MNVIHITKILFNPGNVSMESKWNSIINSAYNIKTNQGIDKHKMKIFYIIP